MEEARTERPLSDLAVPSSSVWCIVSVYRPDLLEVARERFRGHDNVEVVLDRRVGERRQRERVEAAGDAAADRRRAELQERLRRDGFVMAPRGV